MKSRQTLCLASGCFLSFMLSGCFGPVFGHHLEKNFFFNGNRSDRVQEMRHYNLENQYRIFLYGQEHIEPPTLALAQPIAEKGKDAVPFLSEKLRAATHEIEMRDLCFLFETMATRGYYDVKSDPTLMSLLEAKVSSMDYGKWRGSCENDLDRIRRTH